MLPMGNQIVRSETFRFCHFSETHLCDHLLPVSSDHVHMYDSNMIGESSIIPHVALSVRVELDVSRMHHKKGHFLFLLEEVSRFPFEALVKVHYALTALLATIAVLYFKY